GHYVIHGERLRDQKTTLECTLRPGLVYNKSHVDSDSSSSHSHQETPPTAAAAPIVTVESASGFGPATPPQRRRSSAQVRPPTPGGLGWGGRGYEDYRRAGPPAPLALSTCVVRFAKTG
ncbi:hypothetical protein E2I00_001102, partial [Balaenoptera physalus]